MPNTTILQNNAFVVEKLPFSVAEGQIRINAFIRFDSAGIINRIEEHSNIVRATYGKYAEGTSLLDALLQEHASERAIEEDKIRALNG